MICNGAPPVVIVPTDLTVARICRANPSIGKEAAHQMAAELHDIIAGVRKFCAARPGYSAADENDIVQTMMRGVVDDRPRGDAAAQAAAYDAGANDSIYLAVMLTDPDDPDDSDNNLFRASYGCSTGSIARTSLERAVWTTNLPRRSPRRIWCEMTSRRSMLSSKQ